MGQDYTRRYGKEDQQRRGRKFHSPFSSYSSNPNPFPPQNVQSPSGVTKAPMFSSRRQETSNNEYSSSPSWYSRRGPGGYRGRPNVVEGQQQQQQQQHSNRMRHTNTPYNKYTATTNTENASGYSTMVGASPNGSPTGNSPRSNIRHNHGPYDYSVRRPASSARYNSPRRSASGGAYENMPRFPSTHRNSGDRNARYSNDSYNVCTYAENDNRDFHESRSNSINKKGSAEMKKNRVDSSDTHILSEFDGSNDVQKVAKDSESKIVQEPAHSAVKSPHESSILTSDSTIEGKLHSSAIPAKSAEESEPSEKHHPSDERVIQKTEDLPGGLNKDLANTDSVKKEMFKVNDNQIYDKEEKKPQELEDQQETVKDRQDEEKQEDQEEYEGEDQEEETKKEDTSKENKDTVAISNKIAKEYLYGEDNDEIIEENAELVSVDNNLPADIDGKDIATITSENTENKQNESITKPNILPIETENAIDYSNISGCIFPMRNAELMAWELRHKPLVKKNLWLKYLNKNKINDFDQYSFLESELLIFKQADAFKLQKFFSLNSEEIEKKHLSLTEEWIYRSKLWSADVKFYDKQLSQFYQDSDEKKKDEEDKEVQKPKSSRRNRHGDSVRTEAEFMEILKTLEQERERDPLVRAQYGAATIPNMILDPLEKFEFESFMDCNNLKTNKDEWAHRLITDPIDNFTIDEHEKFSRAYLMYPKRFGKISQNMGGIRTHEECVLHYYRTKKEANYKQLLINKNKRAKKSKSMNAKKPGKKLEKGNERRNPTETPELEPSGTPIEDISGEFILGSRKRKPGITVPMKKQTVYESGTDDQSMNESNSQQNLIEPVPPIKDEINESVAIAMAAQNIELANNAATIKDENSSTMAAIPLSSYASSSNEERKRKKRRTEEGHSSYWSVHETNNFPQLLQEFGSDWDGIARVLKTKTAAMTRNYYQRSLNDHPEWRVILLNADSNKKDLVSNDGGNSNHIPITQALTTNSVIDKDNQNPVESSKLLPPLQQSLAGPPVGFFYKKPESYTSVVPKPIINELPPTLDQNELAIHQSITGNTVNTNNGASIVEYGFQASGQPNMPNQIFSIQDNHQKSPSANINEKFNKNGVAALNNSQVAVYNDNLSLPIVKNQHSIVNRQDHFAETIPKPPVRSSIRSLLNSDDAMSTNEQASGLASLAALAPLPVLSSGNTSINSLMNATSIAPNVAHNVGINGLAAVAGFYADTNGTQSIVANSKEAATHPANSPLTNNINNTTTTANNQSSMSALNALAKVAFEQN